MFRLASIRIHPHQACSSSEGPVSPSLSRCVISPLFNLTTSRAVRVIVDSPLLYFIRRFHLRHFPRAAFLFRKCGEPQLSVLELTAPLRTSPSQCHGLCTCHPSPPGPATYCNPLRLALCTTVAFMQPPHFVVHPLAAPCILG
jgi:hypothetical protein